MTFHIKKFPDLAHAVDEYKTRDYPEAPLVIIFTDPMGKYYRVSMNDETLVFEPADETGARKR